MCLLIAGKANKIRTTLLNYEEMTRDIYLTNSDGIGAMYVSSKKGLRTPKLVPTHFNQLLDFVKQLPDDDRNMALHFRMRTHGDTDLDNCHPYTVLPGRIALMHNGVLSQGNDDDKTKSDTWHYIKNVIRPQLEVHPKLFLLPQWLGLIESDIGTGNRFAFMDQDGELIVANKRTGIEYDGMWFSNTYAWEPSMLIPDYEVKPKWSFTRGVSKRSSNASARSTLYDYDAEYSDRSGFDYDSYSSDHYNYGVPTKDDEAGPGARFSDTVDYKETFDEVAEATWDAITSADVDALTELLSDTPYFVMRTLMEEFEFICSVDPGKDLSSSDEEIVRLLEVQDRQELARMVLSSEARTKKIAEVMCWYGDWYGKSPADKEDAANDATAEVEVDFEPEFDIADAPAA